MLLITPTGKNQLSNLCFKKAITENDRTCAYELVFADNKNCSEKQVSLIFLARGQKFSTDILIPRALGSVLCCSLRCSVVRTEMACTPTKNSKTVKWWLRAFWCQNSSQSPKSLTSFLGSWDKTINDRKFWKLQCFTKIVTADRLLYWNTYQKFQVKISMWECIHEWI